MKEIYDEKYKGQKDRSSSRNSRKNEYSSSESYDNIMNQYRKSSDIYSVSAKQSYKKFGNNEQNICNIKIDEVSFSHKKPNLQNKLYMKYNESSGGDFFLVFSLKFLSLRFFIYFISTIFYFFYFFEICKFANQKFFTKK